MRYVQYILLHEINSPQWPVAVKKLIDKLVYLMGIGDLTTVKFYLYERLNIILQFHN